jgi:UDP-N-acetyl-D-glucosamine/UDP-N-acetyl-D-galactosamine dehydrogenase
MATSANTAQAIARTFLSFSSEAHSVMEFTMLQELNLEEKQQARRVTSVAIIASEETSACIDKSTGEERTLPSPASATRRIAVIGLGYVGLPLATAFAANQRVIGFDIDATRVEELCNGYDKTNSLTAGEIFNVDITFTSKLDDIKQCDLYVIVVPTPITADKKPDLTSLISASRAVGECLKSGDIVVYESSVFPGATEGICIPILEQASGLTNRQDFTVGYSPERTNYGDTEHTLANCVKVISAQDEATFEVIREVYGDIVKAGLCEASSIQVAEIAKLVENTQRDLNIALMNEIAMIVNAMGLSAAEVLRVASTKWNFLDFKPGLVGGHCVPVDPHYLIHAATESGCSTKLIAAARSINDSMHEYVVQQTIKLIEMRKPVDSKSVHSKSTDSEPVGSNMVESNPIDSIPHVKPRVGVFGLTFKGNCPDIRESQPLKIVNLLESAGFQPLVYDPFASSSDVFSRHGLKLSLLEELTDLAAIIVTVPHSHFMKMTPSCFKKLIRSNAPIVDVPGIYNVMDFAEAGLYVWQL